MSHKLFKLSTAACLVLGASQVLAAQSVSLNQQNLSFLKQNFQTHTKGIASTQGDSLKQVGNHRDGNNVYHQRLQQMYQGAPVVGGYAIVHSKATNGFAGATGGKLTGKVFTDIASEIGAKPSDDALKTALNQFKSEHKDGKLSQEKGSIVVYMDSANKPHWAFRLSVMTENGKSIPKRPSAIVDAKTMKPFVSWNGIKTLRHDAKGMGYGGNELVGEFGYGKQFPLLDISRDDASEDCYLENTDTKVVDMDGGYWSDNNPMEFACKTAVGENTYLTGHDADGYDKINGAYSPTNDALYDGFVIKNMYKDWYGVSVLNNSDGSPMQLVMRVHYGSYYENAFWDGSQMTFGDGQSFFYPLVSLGVGAHEISHGFTEQNSSLEYWAQSGGMNEAFSDMAAMAAEHYSTGEETWLIGGDIVKPGSGMEALRYMETPSKDGMSIDSADDYYSGLDVHYSSGVYNRLYFLIAHGEGMDARKAFDVMVKANQDYWTPNATFESGACGVMSAASDLGYSVDNVKTALHTVGITGEECS